MSAFPEVVEVPSRGPVTPDGTLVKFTFTLGQRPDILNRIDCQLYDHQRITGSPPKSIILGDTDYWELIGACEVFLRFQSIPFWRSESGMEYKGIKVFHTPVPERLIAVGGNPR